MNQCVNCGHTEPHNGPSGDINDACTHPGCTCGYDSRGTTIEYLCHNCWHTESHFNTENGNICAKLGCICMNDSRQQISGTSYEISGEFSLNGKVVVNIKGSDIPVSMINSMLDLSPTNTIKIRRINHVEKSALDKLV